MVGRAPGGAVRKITRMLIIYIATSVCAVANRPDLHAISGRRAEALGQWEQIPHRIFLYILSDFYGAFHIKGTPWQFFHVLIKTDRTYWIPVPGMIIFPPGFSPSRGPGPNLQRSLSS